MFVTFFITLGALIGLLYLSACIPKEAFRDNLLKSAKYLEENEDEFYYIKENNRRTIIDNYADTIVYNIMYSIDSEYRMESLIISPFYSDHANPEYQMITLLREKIEEEKEIDTVYDRYWHGMQMILRPLFVFFDIVQIRIVMSVLLIGLLLILVWNLWKKGQRVFAVSVMAGAVFVSYPMLGMSMEYTAPFLIMPVISLMCMNCYKDRNTVINVLLVSGMCCGFFDILTTETIAVVIPLAIVFCMRQKEDGLDSFWKELRFMIVSGVVWGIGYLGIVVSKWILSSITLGENRFIQALTMMAYRQGADVAAESGSGLSQPMEALARNIRLLLGVPLNMEYRTVLMISVIVTGILICFVYLYRKTGKECILPTMLALLACVPVARILILNSHSYQHSYFTYRALFGSICCIITATAKVIDVNLLKRT